MARPKPLPKATPADSKVSQDDVEAAKKAWKRDAPSPYKRLLDAKPKGGA